ncbi:MAG: carbohydrate kinase family protein [Deferrisomatales bacterium]|nr:carbohydrate kinase family protein [Deferrisomatales bacterium]
MSALICGSVAYDTIMVFEDRFRNHILADQVHILNVAFHVPTLRREFGGCAGNVAYNLVQLGMDAHPLATVGDDFAPYAAWMDRCGIRRDLVRTVPGTFTAQAFITTDLDDNQITAFHPGAMDHAHVQPIPTGGAFRVAMVSPDGRRGMIEHAEQLAEASIPFVFDPGQGLPLFSGEELRRFVDLASWVALNDYESRLLAERTGLGPAQMAERVEAVVVTRGAEGSRIWAQGTIHEIPAAPARTVADPTGCGDAYRAGILYGILEGLDWPTAGRIAALLGAAKVASHGTQNHAFDVGTLAERFFEAFGYRI